MKTSHRYPMYIRMISAWRQLLPAYAHVPMSGIVRAAIVTTPLQNASRIEAATAFPSSLFSSNGSDVASGRSGGGHCPPCLSFAGSIPLALSGLIDHLPNPSPAGIAVPLARTGPPLPRTASSLPSSVLCLSRTHVFCVPSLPLAFAPPLRSQHFSRQGTCQSHCRSGPLRLPLGCTALLPWPLSFPPGASERKRSKPKRRFQNGKHAKTP